MGFVCMREKEIQSFVDMIVGKDSFSYSLSG